MQAPVIGEFKSLATFGLPTHGLGKTVVAIHVPDHTFLTNLTWSSKKVHSSVGVEIESPNLLESKKADLAELAVGA